MALPVCKKHAESISSKYHLFLQGIRPLMVCSIVDC